MKNQLKTLLLLGILSTILVGFSALLGQGWPQPNAFATGRNPQNGVVAVSDDEDAASPLALLAMAIVAPIAATLVQPGISRSREYLADESGARVRRLRSMSFGARVV